MNKKILIGSMLVLTLLLLMPSLPAIQYNTINENIYEEQYRANVKEIFEERKSGSWKYFFLLILLLVFDY